MKTGKLSKNREIAVLDRDRKGIFIHKDQLEGSPFNVGDRFSIKIGRVTLFALTIVKDGAGDIIFDKNGIFIKRTRRVDMLLGGIFDEYVIDTETGKPGTIEIRPLQVVMDNEIL
jgi:hypothetical protein